MGPSLTLSELLTASAPWVGVPPTGRLGVQTTATGPSREGSGRPSSKTALEPGARSSTTAGGGSAEQPQQVLQRSTFEVKIHRAARARRALRVRGWVEREGRAR